LKKERLEMLDALHHRKPLSREMLAVVRSQAESPADIAAVREELGGEGVTGPDDHLSMSPTEVLKLMYLDRATEGEKKEYDRMTPEEQERHVQAWALTGGMP
jgi:hypothetical protein